MQKTCAECSSGFEIEDRDLEFYEEVSPVFAGKKHSIPPPTHCPKCRQQRRLAWRNEQNLYSRDCDLCGKHIVSVYDKDVSSFPVYCIDCWWSDKWNAEKYGRSYDPSRPFLDQWKELHAVVPKLAIQNDNGIESENSEYCYDISRCRDCYRLIGSWYDQDCHYGLNVNQSKNVVDCNTVSIRSEMVYESLDSQRLYQCAHLQNCESCHDCLFGCDMKGCSDCFCCFGLRHKRFCIFNEQKTEEEYREQMQSFQAGSYSMVQHVRKQFDEWLLRFPRLFAHLQNCEDCEGNNLFNCKKSHGYSVFNSEYSKFIDRSDGPIHCYDIINSGSPQWSCDCVTPDDSYMVLFSIWCWKSKNIILSDNCHSCEQLLGCISMHRGKYCILNTPYSKEEYESLAGTIIEALRNEEDWGEHLPIRLSPFGYNESAASDYYPLTEDVVRSKGWNWKNALPYTKGQQTIEWSQVADDITGIPDSITKEVLSCQKCERNFKITQQELDFYKRMPCPLPRRCFNCRYMERYNRKTPTELWWRKCDKCKKDIHTAYSQERPEIIYCEKCYLAEVY